MAVYVALAGMMVITYLVMQNKRNGRDSYVKLVFLVLYFVSSLRADIIGSDHQVYVNIFYSISRSGFAYDYGYEKGYVLLNMLANFFSNHYVALSFVINFLIFTSVYCYINKFVESRYKDVAVLIFFLNPYLYIQSTFNILRQGCATAVLLFAMHYLCEKKWIQYMFLVLVAAQFHKASYVFLLLVVFRIIKWKRSYFIILSTVAFIMNMVLDNDAFLRYIADILGYSGYVGFGKSMFDFKLYAFFIYGIVIFFSLHYEQLYVNQEEKFFIDLYLASLSMLPVFVKNDAAYRIYIILVFLSIPAVSFICKNFNHEMKRKQYIVIRLSYFMYYVAFFSAFFMKLMYDDDSFYIPFKFFWQV